MRVNKERGAINFVVIAVVVVLLLGAVWYVFVQNEKIVDRPLAGENIIAFGDSLVKGVGATAGSDMVSVLELRIGEPIVNAGKSGDTTKTALARLEADVLSQNPRVVIILLGGNDALSNIPIEQTFSQLTIMIDLIHEKGSAVLLLGVRGGILADKYKKDFERLAKEKRVSYISDILRGVFGHADLMSDAIHPNDQGYAKMAERIEPVLKEMLR